MIKNITAILLLMVIPITDLYAACDRNYQYSNPTGQVTSDFGVMRTRSDGSTYFHQGTDHDTSLQNPNVYASQNGKVVETGYTASSGNYVIVENAAGNVRTVYMHAGSVNVSVGQTVTTSTLLGDWGTCTGRCHTTGNSEQVCPSSNPCTTGSHLHHEVQVETSSGWKTVDEDVLKKMIQEGKNPCDPDFGDEAWARTVAAKPQFVSRPFGGGGSPVPTTPGGTPVPAAGLCV